MALVASAFAIGAMAAFPSFFEKTVTLPSGVAVLMSLYFGGFGPGLLATTLTVAGACYYVLEPVGTFAVADPADRLRAAMLFALLSVASMIGGALKQERLRASTREAQLRASETRYRTLLEQASDGIFVAAPDGRFVVVNARGGEMLGYAAGELLGVSLEAVIDPEDLARQPIRWRELDTTERVIFERMMVRKDGSRVPVEVSARMMRDGQVQAIVRDITERRRAEEALRASEGELRGLVGAMSDVVVVVDREGVIQKVPAATPEVLPMPADQLAGRRLHDVFGPERGDEMVGHIRESLASGEPRTHDIPLRIGERTLLFRATVSPMTEDRVVVLSRDVTRERAAEGQLEAARELLAQSQKLEAVGRLAGGVAHDFNNLLTVISGNAELALDGLPPGDPRREAIEEVRRAGERAAALTRQLLAFSRRQVLDPRPLDLGHVVRDVERMLRRLIREDIALVLELDPAETPVFADRGQLEQVVLNLVVNARDAMPEGGRLTLRTRRERLAGPWSGAGGPLEPGDYVVLEVADTGVGMDEATQSRMFEPFFTTKPVGQGTGLGLSMVHGIVEQSRGAIRVRSAPGEGTAIAIHLPQLAADEQARSAAGPAEPSEPVRATILLVEDEPPVRQLGRRVLERLGHTVLEADGASSALAIEAGHPGPIHLLITDLVMPGMNGRDLAERLVTRRPSMRVLFLSGYLAPDLEFAEGPLRDARAMLKPFSVEGLRETVGRLLRDAAG